MYSVYIQFGSMCIYIYIIYIDIQLGSTYYKYSPYSTLLLYCLFHIPYSPIIAYPISSMSPFPTYCLLPIPYSSLPPLFPPLLPSHFPLPPLRESIYILYIYINIVCIFLVGAAGIYEFNYMQFLWGVGELID